MDELLKLKAEIQALESKAGELMRQPHEDTPFHIASHNIQRGKYIAYGHILSLIEQSLNKTTK